MDANRPPSPPSDPAPSGPSSPDSSWIHRVDISELDPYSHANHTAYIKWLEEGRERLLRSRGFSFLVMAGESRRPVLANLNLDFKGQANWGDEIAVETRVEKLGRSSVTFGHGMRSREGREVLRGTVTMVFVDGSGRPAEIPEEFRRAFGNERALP